MKVGKVIMSRVDGCFYLINSVMGDSFIFEIKEINEKFKTEKIMEIKKN